MFESQENTLSNFPNIQVPKHVRIYKKIRSCKNSVICAGIITTVDSEFKPVIIKTVSCPSDSQTELRCVSTFSNVPNMLRSLYSRAHGDSYILVSPLYPDDSYEHMWGQSPLIHRFLARLCTTLSLLHERGCTHRDIKPANILWDRETEEIRLIDFDLCTFEENPSGFVGTPVYMAPEITREKNVYSSSVDVYSTGVVLGQLLFSCHENDVSDSSLSKWRTKAHEKRNKCRLYNLFLSMTETHPVLRPNMVEIVSTLNSAK